MRNKNIEKEKRRSEKLKKWRINKIKHSILRAKERYNLDLSEYDIKQIGKLVSNNQFIREDFTFTTNPNRRIQLKYKDTVIWVAYCLHTNCISTFLPEDTRRTFSDFR